MKTIEVAQNHAVDPLPVQRLLFLASVLPMTIELTLLIPLTVSPGWKAVVRPSWSGRSHCHELALLVVIDKVTVGQLEHL